MDKIKSGFLKVNKKDIKRALGLGIGTALTYLFGAMCSGSIPSKELLLQSASVLAGASGSYLVKNWLTNSDDEFLKGDSK